MVLTEEEKKKKMELTGENLASTLEKGLKEERAKEREGLSDSEKVESELGRFEDFVDTEAKKDEPEKDVAKTEDTNKDTQRLIDAEKESQIKASKEEQKRQEDILEGGAEEEKKAAIEGADAVKEEKTKTEEEFSDEQKKILKDSEDRMLDLEKQIQDIAEKRKKDLVSGTEAKKEKALDVAEAALQLQKAKDELAIQEATKKNDIALQQSRVAFSKLGLNFSTAAITTAQDIHRQGATEIAGLKIQANYNQARNRIAVEQLEFDYTKEVNDIIETADSQVISSRKRSSDIIFKIQNSILLTDRQKKLNIEKAKDEYVNKVEEAKKKMENDMNNATVKIRQESKKREGIYQKQQDETKNNIEIMYKSGQLYNKTPSELRKLELEGGLPPGFLNQQLTNDLVDRSKEVIASMGLKFLTPNAEIISQMEELIKNGYTPEDAMQKILPAYIENSNEYKKIEAEAKAKEEAELREADLKRRKAEADILASKALASQRFASARKSASGGVGVTGGGGLTSSQKKSIFSKFKANARKYTGNPEFAKQNLGFEMLGLLDAHDGDLRKTVKFLKEAGINGGGELLFVDTSNEDAIGKVGLGAYFVAKDTGNIVYKNETGGLEVIVNTSTLGLTQEGVQEQIQEGEGVGDIGEIGAKKVSSVGGKFSTKIPEKLVVNEGDSKAIIRKKEAEQTKVLNKEIRKRKEDLIHNVGLVIQTKTFDENAKKARDVIGKGIKKLSERDIFLVDEISEIKRWEKALQSLDELEANREEFGF